MFGLSWTKKTVRTRADRRVFRASLSQLTHFWYEWINMQKTKEGKNNTEKLSTIFPKKYKYNCLDPSLLIINIHKNMNAIFRLYTI